MSVENLLWGFENILPKKKVALNPKPFVGETGWKRPTGFPSLAGATRIALDLETYDPDLMDFGPGAFRGVGHIVGASIATDSGVVGYWPMRHTEEPQDNFDPDDVLRWLRKELKGPQLKIGFNLLYDLSWLHHEGVVVEGRCWDCWTAEKLLDHTAEASLEAVAQRRLGEGKSSDELYRFLHAFYGKGHNPGPDELRSMIAHIRGAPPRLAGIYAESDTVLPLALQTVQGPLLESAGLMDVFELENKLLPLLVRMRSAGVAVDIRAAEKAHVEFTANISTLQGEIEHLAGTKFNPGSAEEVGRVFDGLNIRYPVTEKTKRPSITTEFLETLDHPLAEKLSELANLKKFKGTFLEGYILNSHKSGKIYPEFNPMKAITGRMSSSRPNAQNLPSRNALAASIRAIFIPDEGHHHFRKYDYSSVESRILAHFAEGIGADALRAEYNANPSTDYHSWSQNMVKKVTGIELPRKYIKNLNFAKCYGASNRKLARMLKLTQEEADPVFQAFADGLPYVDGTLKHFARMVESNGETRTIMGRRVPFSMWESQNDYGSMPLPFEAALHKYGTRIRRAYTHKACNYVVQGSAADLMKSFLVQCYEQGVFDVTSIPRMIIHDEATFSVPDDTQTIRDAFREMKRIMESAVKFKVPIQAVGEWGPTWSETYVLDH